LAFNKDEDHVQGFCSFHSLNTNVRDLQINEYSEKTSHFQTESPVHEKSPYMSFRTPEKFLPISIK